MGGKKKKPVLRRVRVNPRIAGTELAGTERGTPIPIPPPTRWRPSLTRNPRNTAETRGITRGPVKHSHTFGREFSERAKPGQYDRMNNHDLTRSRG